MSEALAKVADGDPRLQRIRRAVASYQGKPDALIQVLHLVQDAYGHLPMPLIELVAREMHVPPSRAFGVATFYHYFSLRPKAEHTCLVCTGTACYVKGAQALIDRVGKEFGLKPGGVTPDGKLGLETARCLGACGLAPAVVVDADVQAKADAGRLGALLRARLEAP
jgi:bidirectional [NiFe] hydrogenase diaphorase subunit